MERVLRVIFLDAERPSHVSSIYIVYGHLKGTNVQ